MAGAYFSSREWYLNAILIICNTMETDALQSIKDHYLTLWFHFLLPEEQTISSHGIDDSRHWEERAQQTDCQSCNGADGHYVFGSLEAMYRKHLHQWSICVNVSVGDHQSEDHTDLWERQKQRVRFINLTNEGLFCLVFSVTLRNAPITNVRTRLKWPGT